MPKSNHMQVIEINGIKMEVDTRHAKRIDTFKTGDPVKILVKGYSDQFTVHDGIIAAFEQFEKLPTITVAYLELNYGDTKLVFAHINSASSEKYELISGNVDNLPVDKAMALQGMQAQIDRKQEELNDLTNKRNYFTANFGRHFEPEAAREYAGAETA